MIKGKNGFWKIRVDIEKCEAIVVDLEMIESSTAGIKERWVR